MTEHEHHNTHRPEEHNYHEHHEKKAEDLPEAKLAIFWVLGSITILAGSWIAGHLEWVLGTTPVSYYGALLVSFILILFGGLAWIGVAVGVAQQR